MATQCILCVPGDEILQGNVHGVSWFNHVINLILNKQTNLILIAVGTRPYRLGKQIIITLISSNFTGSCPFSLIKSWMPCSIRTRVITLLTTLWNPRILTTSKKNIVTKRCLVPVARIKGWLT